MYIHIYIGGGWTCSSSSPIKRFHTTRFVSFVWSRVGFRVSFTLFFRV